MRQILSSVYGRDNVWLSSQIERYTDALEAFRNAFGPGPVAIFRAPGRVNLIGEHTDYNHGYVLPMALDRDTLLLARRRNDPYVHLHNMEEDFAPCEFLISDTLPPRPIGNWANYAQGPAQLLADKEKKHLCGMDGLVCGRAPWGIPRGAGLSSSSALTVAITVALASLNNLSLEGTALAMACSRAEWYVGTRGGIMDHFAGLLAQQGHALWLDCRPDEDQGTYAYRSIPLPDDHAIVIVDSGVRHQNTGPLFNHRVAEVRIGVRLLQKRYGPITHLRDMEGIPWSEYADLLPEALDKGQLDRMGIDPATLLGQGIVPDAETFYVKKRCRHVITENARVQAMVQALLKNDLPSVGALLNEAHASARDDYEISTPEIETLVTVAQELPGVFGARLTGAGWGGCIVALVHRARADSFTREIISRYADRAGRTAQAFVCRPAPGAGRLLTTTI